MKQFGLNYESDIFIRNFWKRNMVITKNKLTKAQMKKEGLSYDGWGKTSSGLKEYYYYRVKK